jgi:hypothetical protein
VLKCVTLKTLIETWEKNPRITLTELVIMYESDAQNIKRWMKSAGFSKVTDDDKKYRFVRRLDIKPITQTPPEGLTEAQRTEFYVRLGYDSYSICVHQNVLLSTVEERRQGLQPSIKHSLESDTREESVVEQHELPWEPPVLGKIADSPEDRENAIYEDGQHKNNFEEFGDKRPHHIDEITQAQFFPNGIPTCQRCQRDVIYTDIIHYNNTRPAYSDSFINVDARPKIVFPMAVSYTHINQWAEYVDFPKTGYKDIDDIRILEAFAADTIANFFRNRMAYIAKELLQKRKKPGYHWGGNSYK